MFFFDIFCGFVTKAFSRHYKGLDDGGEAEDEACKKLWKRSWVDLRRN